MYILCFVDISCSFDFTVTNNVVTWEAPSSVILPECISSYQYVITRSTSVIRSGNIPTIRPSLQLQGDEINQCEQFTLTLYPILIIGNMSLDSVTASNTICETRKF